MALTGIERGICPFCKKDRVCAKLGTTIACMRCIRDQPEEILDCSGPILGLLMAAVCKLLGEDDG